jgi:hypothetical protein
MLLWLVFVLLLFLCFYVYTGYYGTPWGKNQQALQMKSYLNDKYDQEFVIENTSYNHLSETYQAFAYPKDQPDLLFIVQQDHDSDERYSDTYPKVYWGSGLAAKIKQQIKRLYPDLDEKTFNLLQISEREENYSLNVPTYHMLHISQASCSITINLRASSKRLNSLYEQQRINRLKKYLRAIHLPVLVEIRYNGNDRVIFLTEEGRIIGKS